MTCSLMAYVAEWVTALNVALLNWSNNDGLLDQALWTNA